MANLVVSAPCNQGCTYCFTTDHAMQTSQPFLPMSRFEERLEFLTRSGIQEARLLGGEPSLHPQFDKLVARARAAGKTVVVFSNGLMPESALASLEALTPEACTVMVNVTPPEVAGSDGIVNRQRETLRRLGRRALPGVNLYRPDLSLDFLLPLVADTGCRPAIRLGMAHPCLSGDNRHLMPNQYRSVAVEVVRLARAAAQARVTLDLDCGFVRCMFSDADLQVLKDAGTDPVWRCNPILDVDIKGQVIHCFPLARLGSLPLLPESEARALRQAFEERTRPYRQAGVFRECSTCAFKTAGECTGGCLATTIRRFRQAPFHLDLPRKANA